MWQLSGLAIVGLCAFLLVDEQRSKLFRLFRPDDHYALYLALTGTGALALLIGFLGCCVAPKKGSMLAAYVASLLVVMACELAIGTLAFLLQDKILSDIKDNLDEALKKDYGKKTDVTSAFDWVQAKMLCCGVSGPADYAQSAWKVESIGHGDNVSKTCCRLHDEPDSHKNPRPLNDTLCQSAAADNPYRHSQGCLGALEELVKRESVLLIAVGCGVAALEMVGIALSVYVCKET